jgi:mannose-1-phosphate guanylyltransferase
MQRHQHRSEHWVVSEGRAVIRSRLDSGYAVPAVRLNKHDSYDISKNTWHQLTNPYDEPCKIIEIQYGSACDEMDIERL